MATAEFDTSRPVLITGAGGFVGRNLVATLRALGCEDLLLFEKDDTLETLAHYVMVETVAGSAGYLAKSTMENVMGRKTPPPGQDV